MTRETCSEIFAGVNYNDTFDLSFRFVLIALYLAVFLQAVIQLIKIWRKSEFWGTTQSVFHIVIATASFVRVIQLPWSNSVYVSMSAGLSAFVNSFPDFMFFSAYLLVSCYWAAVFQLSNSSPSAKFQTGSSPYSPSDFQATLFSLYLKIVLVALISLIVICVVAEMYSIYEVPIISGFYIASLSSFLALFVAYQGYLIYSSLRHLSIEAPTTELGETPGVSFASSPVVNSLLHRIASRESFGSKVDLVGSKYREAPVSTSAFESPILQHQANIPPYYSEPYFPSPAVSELIDHDTSSSDHELEIQQKEIEENVAELIEDALNIRKNVTLVACICTFFFLIKGILVCILNVVFCPRDGDWVNENHHYLYIWFGYMFFADIVPTVLILFLVGSTEHAHSPKAKENDPLNSSNPKMHNNYGAANNLNYHTHDIIKIKDGFLVTADAHSLARVSSSHAIPRVQSMLIDSSTMPRVSSYNRIPRVEGGVTTYSKLPHVSSRLHIGSDGVVDPSVIVQTIEYDDPRYQAMLEAELRGPIERNNKKKSLKGDILSSNFLNLKPKNASKPVDTNIH